MGPICEFYKTTVGKKIVAAVTGALLFLFLVAHMVGNLKAFAGIDPATGMYKLDVYARFLREFGHMVLGYSGVLWLTRIGLLVVFVIHVVTVIQLTLRNRAAGGGSYAKNRYLSSTVASRTMAIGGLILLAYVIYHILHFTTGTLHFHGFKHGHVYANAYNAFQVWWVVLIYCVAMVILGLHLYHGLWSLFQTLGLDGPRTNRPLRCLAGVLAVVIALGFMAVPLGFASGILPAPTTQVTTQTALLR
ncbi:MAG: succinate dehydrogenase [Candidatus Dadabacteria bacterium]|nr:MAG: succinate dehydrogenase [Candidatus Dadabacteria bacterium]